MSNVIQFLIQTNTINFIIVLTIIIVIVKKLNIGNKIDKIKSDITNYVETSEKEKQQTEVELSRINDKISKLPAVIERIKKSTENSVRNIERNIKEETEEKKQDISNNAKRLFNLETKKFKSRLTSILAEKSIEIARENAIKRLIENPDLHGKYIDNAIEELDGIVL